MINIDFDCAEFCNHKKMLWETSVDRSKGEYYMTDSTRDAIDFDGVVEEYTKMHRLNERPRSNDALFQDDQGTVTFVEFKHGEIGKSVVFDLRRKIFDSVLILTDITRTRISDLRENAVYILVYNEDANADLEDDEDPKKNIQDSAAYNDIADTFTQWGGTRLKKFGIHYFEKFCFKSTYTLTQTEFEKYLNGN